MHQFRDDRRGVHSIFGAVTTTEDQSWRTVSVDTNTERKEPSVTPHSAPSQGFHGRSRSVPLEAELRRVKNLPGASCFVWSGRFVEGGGGDACEAAHTAVSISAYLPACRCLRVCVYVPVSLYVCLSACQVTEEVSLSAC